MTSAASAAMGVVTSPSRNPNTVKISGAYHASVK